MNVWLKFQVSAAEAQALKLIAMKESGQNGGKNWWRSWLRRAMLKAIKGPPKTKLTMEFLNKTMKRLKDGELK